jgi:hypothetical protein
MLRAELSRASPEKRHRIEEILEQVDASAWLDMPGKNKK